MTSNEIKKIIEGLSKPKETNVFYDIEEIIKHMDAYVVNYWNDNRNKYKDDKLIAILAPKKFFSVDVVYFFDRGVFINGEYTLYDEIIFIGMCDFFHGMKFNKNDYMFSYSDERMVWITKKNKTTLFALDVIEAIIHEKNALYDDNMKIKYYLDLYNHVEKPFAKIILYKKIIHMTQNPNLVGNLVAEHGYAEYQFKICEVGRKMKLEQLKRFPLQWAEYMTLVMKKKADRSILNEFYKMHENILSDCAPYLKLMQDCNQLKGYKAFVTDYYYLLHYASEIQKKISDKLIYEFNSTICVLKDKIEMKIIKISQEDNADFLSMVKLISDIYLGNIIVEFRSGEKKENKYYFLKNVDKAYYWLNIYTNRVGCDNTVEYQDVMFNLAEIYKYGTSNISADESRMIDYLKMAANHGSVKASKFLAEYYIEKNSEEKDKWIQLAKNNGQKIKDKRSINEKMKERVGIDITEVTETIESITGIGRNVAGMAQSLRDTVETISGIATDAKNAKADKKEAENREKEAERNAEHGKLEHEQYLDGQKVENKRAKAKNMKAERKADKAIAVEEKKRS